MKMVFINNTHPETRHVSGMRLHQFALAMARRGHQVVLLTGVPPEGQAPNGAEDMLASRLAAHDWSEPMIVEVAPVRMRGLEAARGNRLPTMLRRMCTAWYFIVHGGVFADWGRTARPIGERLAELFEPEVVWATFGNTSNLALAQVVSRHADCPWVIDVKDNWEHFIPHGLRRHMSRRLGNAAAMTANAEKSRDMAVAWMPVARSRLVYSGVHDAFLRGTRRSDDGERSILLVGSVYSDALLGRFLMVLKRWRDTLPPDERRRFGFRYVGSDHERVLNAVASVDLTEVAIVQSHVPIEVLADHAKRATASCYLWSPHGFHHKLLELLATETPVIAFPGEIDESRKFASQFTTPFYICEDDEALAAAFSRAWQGDHVVRSEQCSMPAWRWDDFAQNLEDFFIEVVDSAHTMSTHHG